MSSQAGRCTGTGTKPLACPVQALGMWLHGGSLLHGLWQQEVHYPPRRVKTSHRGMQESLCRANATHLSAAGEQGWALEACLGAQDIEANIS